MIHSALPAPWKSIHHRCVDSTNRWALEGLQRLADCTLVTAGEQTGGRGRLDRSWFSPPDLNLYMTAVLKPKVELLPGGVAETANLGQLMALAIHLGLDELGVATRLKWPNDVMARGIKASGILSESRFTNGQLLGCVVGVGVNVNMDAALLARLPFEATSLREEMVAGGGAAPSPHGLTVLEVLRVIMGRFAPMYRQFCEHGGFAQFHRAWAEAADLVGATVAVELPDGRRARGTVESLLPGGQISLKENNGGSLVVTAGDLTILDQGSA